MSAQYDSVYESADELEDLALLFESGRDGPARRIQMNSGMRAQGLWKVLGHTGAVAFSRTGDPATGDFRDATVLRKFGDVPDDLSAL
jgi:hypothetical protein